MLRTVIDQSHGRNSDGFGESNRETWCVMFDVVGSFKIQREVVGCADDYVASLFGGRLFIKWLEVAWLLDDDVCYCYYHLGSGTA